MLHIAKNVDLCYYIYNNISLEKSMKRIVVMLLALFMTAFLNIAVFAQETLEVTLIIDGHKLETDVAPILESNRTLVPVRALFESINAKVSWEQQTQKVTIEYGGKEIILFVDSTVAIVDNLYKELDVPAKLVNSRTLIPVRFVSESLGFKVDWEQETRTVRIDTKNKNEDKEKEPEKSNVLSNVEIKVGEKTTQIVIKGVGQANVSKMKLENPNRYVFDFKPAILKTEKTTYATENIHINGVRVGQYEKDIARVVLDVEKFVSYKTEVKDNNYIITFGEQEETKLPEANTKAKNHLVIIDPGHGGSDVGTIGKYNGKEIYEKDVDLDIALHVEKMLENAGIKTYMIRNDDTAVDILKRPEIGNSKKGTIYLSIHNNASSNSDVKGVQIYFSDSESSFKNMSNKQIANIYYEKLAALGLRKAGMVDNPRYIVIHKSNMPAFIIEGAFMSNPDDVKLIVDPEFRKQMATAISEATIEVLNKAE